MLLAFSTPVRAATSDYDRCKLDVNMKYSGFYDFESDATYKKIYDQKYKQEKQKYEEWLNSAITSDLTGNCNGVSYECTRGQKNKDCVPEPCWAIHDETASEFMFKYAIEQEFIQQKILEECGSSPQSEPTPIDNTAPAETDTSSLQQNQKIQCEGPRYVLNEKKNRCEDLLNKKCTPTVENAKKGKNILSNDGTKIICQVTDCKNGYLPNNDGTACEKSEGDCTEEQLNEIPNATKGQKKKGVCYATECGAGYEVEKGKCVAVSPEENKEETDNTPKLSEEDSEKKIAELQDNYDAMKEKEQSTANKLLGAGAMAAMGAGGQMLASSLAEQQADAAAELDMTAYLATFRCDFGQGRNIKGGETDIVLPGGNALAPLYTEYVQLAQDLKVRKEALGMAPGIESEEILDKANMGLYDNESLGKTDGAFTSLASALSNPTGADAAEWAAQKAETSQQLKTGAITAGVGAVASIAANIGINENKKAKQENSAEIIKKYEALKKLQQDVEQLPDQEANATCPPGSTGIYPNCDCGKKIHNKNTNRCENKIAADEVPHGSPNRPENITDNPAIPSETDNQPTITLATSNLFDLGSSTLTEAAEQTITDFATAVKQSSSDEEVYCINVTGHTDRTGNPAINNPLSQQRADAVKKALVSAGINENNIKASGVGSAACKANGNQAECRKVEIKFNSSTCSV